MEDLKWRSVNIYTCSVCGKIYDEEDIMINIETEETTCKYCVAEMEVGPKKHN